MGHRILQNHVFCALGMSLLLAGCSRGLSDTPPLAKVTGVVTLDGKPLQDGSVQFSPDSSRGTTGRMAIGKIKADGSFELTTIEPGDGAQIGFHVVTVESYETVPFDPNNPAMQQPKSLIPVRYGDPAASGLKAEVRGDGENSFTFDLKSAP